MPLINSEKIQKCFSGCFKLTLKNGTGSVCLCYPVTHISKGAFRLARADLNTLQPVKEWFCSFMFLGGWKLSVLLGWIYLCRQEQEHHHSIKHFSLCFHTRCVQSTLTPVVKLQCNTYTFLTFTCFFRYRKSSIFKTKLPVLLLFRRICTWLSYAYTIKPYSGLRLLN